MIYITRSATWISGFGITIDILEIPFSFATIALSLSLYLLPAPHSNDSIELVRRLPFEFVTVEVQSRVGEPLVSVFTLISQWRQDHRVVYGKHDAACPNDYARGSN